MYICTNFIFGASMNKGSTRKAKNLKCRHTGMEHCVSGLILLFRKWGRNVQGTFNTHRVTKILCTLYSRSDSSKIKINYSYSRCKFSANLYILQISRDAAQANILCSRHEKPLQVLKFWKFCSLEYLFYNKLKSFTI